MKEDAIGVIPKKIEIFCKLCQLYTQRRMNSTTVTPADILKERDEARRAGRIAHSANCRGDFMARLDCSCYNCRDAIDPTGEEDAILRNIQRRKSLPQPLTVPPLNFSRLRTSTLSCESDCENTPHPPAYPGHRPVCCEERFTHLPPPPAARRQPSQSLGPASGSLSPIVGIQSPEASPRSFTMNLTIHLNSPPVPIEESYRETEERVEAQLEELLKTYKKLMKKIEKEMDAPGVKHDELAACDDWWNETDAKMNATKKLLDLLKSV